MQSCSVSENSILAVGTNQWPGNESLFLARTLDYYEFGNIKLIELASNTDVISAFQLGVIDVASLTLDEAISVANDMPGVLIFLVMDASHGADKLIANKNIHTVSDLSGKKLGYEKTALGAFFLKEFLGATELDEGDLVLVPATVNQHEAKMRLNEIDAVLTFEPVATNLLSQGYNELFNSSQIPGKIIDVLVTTQKIASEKQQQIEALVAGHWKALDYMKNNEDEAMATIALRLNTPHQQVKKIYEGLSLPNKEANNNLLSGKLQDTTLTLNKLMLEYGMVDKLVDVNQLTTQKFVQ